MGRLDQSQPSQTGNQGDPAEAGGQQAEPGEQHRAEHGLQHQSIAHVLIDLHQVIGHLLPCRDRQVMAVDDEAILAVDDEVRAQPVAQDHGMDRQQDGLAHRGALGWNA